MDFFPSGLIQQDIIRPENEDEVDNREDVKSPIISIDASDDNKENEPAEIYHHSTTSKSSLSSTTSSPSRSSTGEYHSAPWEVSLIQFKPVNNSVSYERDLPGQKLVAVIGRDFDTPVETSDLLQKQYKSQGEVLEGSVPKVKFLGYEVRRKELLSNQFKIEDIQNHDLIAMCYNASEARILLTGSDGFYTSLLKQVERMLGPNKAVFLIYNYPLSRLSTTGSEQIIDPSLSSRLQSQEALKHYLDNGQVLSWMTTPSKTHLQTLHYLTQLDPNPIPYSYTESCGIL